MATAQAALRQMCAICLTLPNTGETAHFGEPCFRVGKKIFASCGEKGGVCRIIIQLEPDHATRLVDSDPRFERYARQKDCVSIDAADVRDWDEVRALVLESYRLRATSRTSKKPRTASGKKSPAKRKR